MYESLEKYVLPFIDQNFHLCTKIYNEKVKVKEGSHMNMIYQKQFYAFQFDFMMINRRTNVYFCED